MFEILPKVDESLTLALLSAVTDRSRTGVR